MRSHLFGIEALVREPNRLGNRGAARCTRRRVDGRSNRDGAERGAYEPGPDANERLRAAALSRTR